MTAVGLAAIAAVVSFAVPIAGQEAGRKPAVKWKAPHTPWGDPQAAADAAKK